MVSRFERFSYAIFQITRYWHKITSDEMAQYGLKGPHAVYLIALSHHPEGVAAARLCGLCGKDKSDVSRAVALMEQHGMLVREGVAGNMYRAKLKLTQKGLAAAQQVSERAALAVEMAGESLSETQRTVLYDALEQIASNLRTISESGLPHQQG